MERKRRNLHARVVIVGLGRYGDSFPETPLAVMFEIEVDNEYLWNKNDSH